MSKDTIGVSSLHLSPFEGQNNQLLTAIFLESEQLLCSIVFLKQYPTETVTFEKKLYFNILVERTFQKKHSLDLT